MSDCGHFSDHGTPAPEESFLQNPARIQEELRTESLIITPFNQVGVSNTVYATDILCCFLRDVFISLYKQRLDTDRKFQFILTRVFQQLEDLAPEGQAPNFRLINSGLVAERGTGDYFQRLTIERGEDNFWIVKRTETRWDDNENGTPHFKQIDRSFGFRGTFKNDEALTIWYPSPWWWTIDTNTSRSSHKSPDVFDREFLAWWITRTWPHPDDNDWQPEYAAPEVEPDNANDGTWPRGNGPLHNEGTRADADEAELEERLNALALEIDGYIVEEA